MAISPNKRRNTVSTIHNITSAFLALGAFSLAACDTAAPDNSALGSGEKAAAGRTVTKARESAVTTTAGRYAFTPTICAIGVEDGVDDIEIAGAGTAPDGSPIYVEFSSTGNSIDIGLGVDQAFATAEHRLIAGQHVTQPFTVAVSGTTVKATGVSLATDQGATIDPNASFEADCSPPR